MLLLKRIIYQSVRQKIIFEFYPYIFPIEILFLIKIILSQDNIRIKVVNE